MEDYTHNFSLLAKKMSDILSLIPQRPPFVMVDRLVSCSFDDAATEFAVRQDNILVDDNKLSATGLMENMAQSCAARLGWLNTNSGKGVQIGVIGEIRNCKFFRQPNVGELLTTKVHIIEDLGIITLATVSVFSGEEEVASCRIKIATV